MSEGRAARLRKACRWSAAIALGVGYSVAAHLASASPTPGVLEASVAIVPMIGLAFLLAWRSVHRVALLATCFIACGLLYSIRHWLVAHYNWVFLLQHAGVYALLCLGFSRTLAAGETPMISRFAQMLHGPLSPALARYTRGATLAWSLYFAGIAATSMLLFWLAPIAVWSAFVNLLGMPLLGLMFLGEYAVRCYVVPPEERAGLLDAIRAYRQSTAEAPPNQP